MLQVALGSFVLAVACAAEGFAGSSSAVISEAFRVFFVVFTMIFLVSAIAGLVRR